MTKRPFELGLGKPLACEAWQLVKWTDTAAGVLTPTHPLPLQELEESRKLYTSQKRALKDALSAAAERDAAEAAAGESGLEAATAAAEEEVERLTQVCGHI